ncbi:MAG: apolipoprotein N-acyltransferase [Sphingomicrobium sp.]
MTTSAPLARFPRLFALAIGAASAFAFEPYALWPLMPLAIAALCALIDRAPTPRRALLIGWLFGMGNFTLGLNWIQFAFTFQDKMPHWLGYIAVVLLSLYLAVYPALAAGLAWRFGKDRPLALVLCLAGAWAITEWLRATIFTGFAWNPLGVTLIDTPWSKVAATLGTYGLSLLVALIGGTLWLALRARWKPALALAAVELLLLVLPGSGAPEYSELRTFDAQEQHSPQPNPPSPPPPPGNRNVDPGFNLGPSPSAFRVVQPNIGQEDKWRAGFADEAAQRLAALSMKPGGQHPQLLLWPEAAITDPLEDARTGEPQAFAEFERSRATAVIGPHDYLITGGLALNSRDGRRVTGAANSIFVLGMGGRVLGRYDKAHLVPYGEYLPMRPLLSAIGLSRLAPGDIDFDPGPDPRTLNLPHLKVGLQICYEIIFSGEVVDRRNRPNFIFNPSNDAWFGRWGPPQHLAQARLRAAEEGLPIIRSTPTGISAVIDANGKIIKSLPWRTAGVIDATLPMPALPTLFARFGNIIPLCLGFLLIIAAIALGARRRYSAT